MTDWDYSIEMVGEFPVYWAVLRNDEGLVETWQSPYQQLPEADPNPEDRKGLTTFLARPLTVYNDQELAIASKAMSELAWEDWLCAKLANCLFKAIREQRDREGGYQPPKAKDEAEQA